MDNTLVIYPILVNLIYYVLLNQINGQDGITIPINGGVTVAAGGGGSQSMWEASHLRNNDTYPSNTITEGTTTLVGVGGSGIGGNGAVWQSGNPTENGEWNIEIGGINAGTIYRYPTDGASNTGSGGGGWSDHSDRPAWVVR